MKTITHAKRYTMYLTKSSLHLHSLSLLPPKKQKHNMKENVGIESTKATKQGRNFNDTTVYFYGLSSLYLLTFFHPHAHTHHYLLRATPPISAVNQLQCNSHELLLCCSVRRSLRLDPSVVRVYIPYFYNDIYTNVQAITTV